MSPTSDIIRQLIVDLGLAEESDGDWPCYVSFFPDQPDEGIAVYDTAGIPDGRVMAGERIEHDGIQIMLRGLDYRTTWEKADLIARTLDIQRQVIVAVESDSSYIIHNVARTGTITPMGMDEFSNQRRYYFTVNAVVTVAEQV